jgi:HAUS augmin-like complex subunit 1
MFSPSLARAALAESKDWSRIDAWLSRHFSPSPVPPFERNSDTLRSLLELADLNERADEERDALAEIEARDVLALQWSRDAARNGARGEIEAIYEALESHLRKEGKASLESMLKLHSAVGVTNGEIDKLAVSLLDLQTTSYSLEQNLLRISAMRTTLEREITAAEETLASLRDETASPLTEDLATQTAEFQRKSKALALRISEMAEKPSRHHSTQSMPIKPSIPDIRAEEERYQRSIDEVRALESQIKGYHGLPHDVDLARLELETLRQDLVALRSQRDEVFETLVIKESPRKR